ncbi:MAG: DNA cytosine methyltransferase [Promethearchaeota archaeon]
MPIKADLRVLDLFSGAGGLSLGFEQAGFSVVAAVECWPPAAATYRRNFPSVKMIDGDIRDNDVKGQIQEFCREKSVDVIIGGFPCQSFSLSGNRDPLDSRSQLYRDYLQVVENVRPAIFVMENVKGLLSMKTLPPDLSQKEVEYFHENLSRIRRYKDLKRYGSQRKLNPQERSEFNKLKRSINSLKEAVKAVLVPLLDLIISEIQDLGYRVQYRILNSADYGTPQTRQRVFIVAIRDDLSGEFHFPEPTCEKYRSVREAIGDLEGKTEGHLPNHDFTAHKPSFVKRLAKVKPGENLYKNFTDAWWRLVPDKPSKTVKENHGAVFIHYSEARVLTPREMARLQDFPDHFVFEDKKCNVLKQIGNAVPVKLARAVATSVMNFLSQQVKIRDQGSEYQVGNENKNTGMMHP